MKVRRGRDSNPRRGYKPLTHLAGERLIIQMVSHRQENTVCQCIIMIDMHAGGGTNTGQNKMLQAPL